MAIAREGTGIRHTAAALASQVHPVFMLPPLAASGFGAVLAGSFEPLAGAAHIAAMFFAVYTAHVKDGLVDFYVRDEDDSHPMTVFGCRAALAGSTAGFLVATAALWATAGTAAALLAVPTWFIGYLHAPQLDMHPVTATVGYPGGIALAILGGFAGQSGTLATAPVVYALIFFLLLSGIKIIDDAKDAEYDRSIGKRTVTVVLGYRRSHELAYGLMIGGSVLVLWHAAVGVLAPATLVAPLVFGAVAAFARRSGPDLATMLLVRGSYLFLAALVAAEWFRPLAGVSLPDIGILGPYTYIATELAFGTVAAFLLHRTGSWMRALRTVVVLYPIAFVWDWYTLRVGVFSIPLRTGIVAFGIPLEEHLFMLVVPGLVIGLHEAVNGRD